MIFDPQNNTTGETTMAAKHNTTITDAEIITLAGDRAAEARALLRACHNHVQMEDGQPEGQFVWRKRNGVMGLTLASCGLFLAWAACDDNTMLDGLFEIAFKRTGKFGPVCPRRMARFLNARARDARHRAERAAV